MHRANVLIILLACSAIGQSAPVFKGRVIDAEGRPVHHAGVLLMEDDLTTLSDKEGGWQIEAADTAAKNLVFHKEGYAYEQVVGLAPGRSCRVVLRKAIKSHATLREERYIQDDCTSVDIPQDPQWNVSFKITKLKGDLAPDSTYTRRDPSAVIKVNGTFYVWYSYSLTHDKTKIAPWDLNELYYATSADGITWTEMGVAVPRGEAGAYDHRSVFTTENLAHAGKYYLVYQAAAGEDGIYNRNTVGMSVADSPDGPWTKLAQPILHPTYTNNLFFDNNTVHDPCIIVYMNKFYLYYKGECNCRDNEDCIRWCNPVCGLKKQVKWGVAIADAPTGHFVKAAHNPVTNTGHEVMVWPYQDGVAILQHQDGPEANTIQFAEDGFNFEIKGSVSNFPEAAGLFRADKSDNNPHAGIAWGMGHKLNWDAGPKGWMYIYRFDIVDSSNADMD